MSIKPSYYRVAEMTSGGRTVDFRVACASIDYYEDVLCPTYSCKIQVVNSGGNIPDGQGNLVSLYEALKISAGEEVKLFIASNSPTNIDLDFAETRSFYNNGVSELERDTEREFFTLHLLSKEAMLDGTIFLGKKYPKETPISSQVETILEESFPGSLVNLIDPTMSPYGWIGMNMHPFLAVTKLASKAVPGETGGTPAGGSATAGFFFYQTSQGFNFRSIDNLISKTPVAKYVSTELNTSRYSYRSTPELPSLDYKIMAYKVVRNQNIVENLTKGTFAAKRNFFDPFSFRLTDDRASFTGDSYIKKGVKNLGDFFDPSRLKLEGATISFTELPSIILTENLNLGTLDTNAKSTQPTTRIEEYSAQSRMRYNSLFNQILNMQVPLNTNLHAGDIIECLFPKVTLGLKEWDEGQLSGIYMIRGLCHHYDTRGSYTSLQIVRDTFGVVPINA